MSPRVQSTKSTLPDPQPYFGSPFLFSLLCTGSCVHLLHGIPAQDESNDTAYQSPFTSLPVWWASPLLVSLAGHCSRQTLVVQNRLFQTLIQRSSSQLPLMAASRGLGALQWHIPSSAFKHLRQHGYAVVDEALRPLTLRDSLREELIAAAIGKANLLVENCTICLDGDTPTYIPKRGIGEFDLKREEVAAALPLLRDFACDPTLRNTVQQGLFQEAGMRSALATQSLKAQVNFGEGACFPLHYDAHPSRDSRSVTCIYYLNPSYQPAAGGQLRLFPLPHVQVDVEPVEGRLVLFSSRFCLHRVLPSAAPRLCFTVWLAEKEPIPWAPEDLTGEEDWGHHATLHPHHRIHLNRLAHDEEWVRSLEESHPASPQRDAMIRKHLQDSRVLACKYGALAQKVREYQGAVEAGVVPWWQ